MENFNEIDMSAELVSDWEGLDTGDLSLSAEGTEEPAEDVEADSDGGADQTGGQERVEEGGPEGEEEGDPAEGGEGGQSADQRFLLKHLDTVKSVDKDEVVQLAQKGMDYDRIREKLETLRQEHSKSSEIASFIEELAKEQGLDTDTFIDQTKASILAEREGLDPRIALERVRLDRERAEIAALRDSRQSQEGAQAAKEQAIRAFVAENTDPKTGDMLINIADIPQSVWQDFDRTGDLIGAYARHENKQLKLKAAELEQKLAAQQKNRENKQKSTNSRQTAGDSAAHSDPWLSDLMERF